MHQFDDEDEDFGFTAILDKRWADAKVAQRIRIAAAIHIALWEDCGHG